jgi:hypothetical protein
MELDCSINGEDVTISEYRNSEQVEHNMNLVSGIGCQIAKRFGIKDLHWVHGENWTVSPDTKSTAEAIKNTIGGDAKVKSEHC